MLLYESLCSLSGTAFIWGCWVTQRTRFKPVYQGTQEISIVTMYTPLEGAVLGDFTHSTSFLGCGDAQPAILHSTL